MSVTLDTMKICISVYLKRILPVEHPVLYDAPYASTYIVNESVRMNAVPHPRILQKL